MKNSAIIILLSISIFTFSAVNIFPGNIFEQEKNISGDSINIAGIVKAQISFARKNPGRTSFIPDLIKEKKAGELNEDFFAFIYRQYLSLNSSSVDLKINILIGIMFFLGIILLILLMKIHKMRKESGFIRYLKTLREGKSAGSPGVVSSNLESIRKLLCENPVCLYNRLAKESGKNYSKEAKGMKIGKGEVQLASKIKSYQISQMFTNENNLIITKANRGI